MRLNVTIPAFALREIHIDGGKLLTSVRFDMQDGRIIIKALALGKIAITIKFRPCAENGKLVLQDAEIDGMLWLANLSQSWLLSKIQKALTEGSKQVFIYDISTASDTIFVSFSPGKKSSVSTENARHHNRLRDKTSQHRKSA